MYLSQNLPVKGEDKLELSIEILMITIPHFALAWLFVKVNDSCPKHWLYCIVRVELEFIKGIAVVIMVLYSEKNSA